MIKVCIINRNYPPYQGATGYHASQLADYLTKTGKYSVTAITLGERSIKNQPIHVLTINSNYKGRNKVLRLMGSAREGYRLIKKALSLNADFYIVLTDPPLLNYWAARMLKNVSWALWTMDLYPQGFVAGGLAHENDRKTSHYLKVLRSGVPDFLISLGTEQRTFLNNIYPADIASVILPIGLKQKSFLSSSASPSWKKKNVITLGYIGNLSEAHEPERIMLLATQMDPNRYQLILSCYGAHAKPLKAALSHLNHVIVLPHLEEGHMSDIDIHVVSLAPQWTHICVPSKALSAAQYGRPVLFFGNQESDTSSYIEKIGWTLSSSKEIEGWLATLNQEMINSKSHYTSTTAAALNQKLHDGWQQIDVLISRAC